MLITFEFPSQNVARKKVCIGSLSLFCVFSILNNAFTVLGSCMQTALHYHTNIELLFFIFHDLNEYVMILSKTTHDLFQATRFEECASVHHWSWSQCPCDRKYFNSIEDWFGSRTNGNQLLVTLAVLVKKENT